MLNRVRLAWAALRGRPIISGVTFRSGIHVSDQTPDGMVIRGNTILRP